MIESPMLAERVAEADLDSLPPADYIAEPKYDGSRNLLRITADALEFFRRDSRRNIFNPVPAWQFPEIKHDAVFNSLKAKSVVLDGELVARDFSSLLQRTHLSDPLKISLASKLNPVVFVAFDIIELDGEDLTSLPLSERKQILNNIFRKPCRNVQIIQTLDGTFHEAFRNAVSQGFEGIVLKKIDSKYVQRRTKDWLKCKKHFTETLEILGYDLESKSRPQRNLSFRVPVLNLITERGRISVPSEEQQKFFFTHRPKFVEVEFQELSKNGKMRFPKFLRFADCGNSAGVSACSQTHHRTTHHPLPPPNRRGLLYEKSPKNRENAWGERNK